MSDTRAALEAGKLRDLNLQDQGGINVICGRAPVGMKKFFGENSLPVIMGSTRIAYLIMLEAHNKDHAAKDITITTSRHTAWIVNGSKLAKRICRECLRCRFMKKRLETQKMSILPDLLQVPSPPFSNIGIDLLGPILVKAMVNKRAKMKVWVVLFVCLNVKAISMELAPGYATNDFLMAFSTHVSQRGLPSFVHSDRGSQLVAAQRNLVEDLPKFDWDLISSTSARHGTTWKFAPAGAQWRNGATEAFGKMFKRSFSHMYQHTELNYAELGCSVKIIANILNDRPVSAQRTKLYSPDEDFLSPLTPNMLITGRNYCSPASNDDSNFDVDLRVRRNFIQDLETSWWYKYKSCLV